MGRQPVVCVVKNAAAVGSELGAAVGEAGAGDGLGDDESVADAEAEGDGEG
ncbi:MAG: hypothetical protein AABM32_04270 [Chloroflexota bacterium]